MSLRAARRGLVLILSLLIGLLRYTFLWLVAKFQGKSVTPSQRAQWMQFCGRIVLNAMGIRFRIEGPVPQGVTLIAANHLSYLDIVIASAALPCAFVAKHEIAHWPFFGALARIGGTIFLDRASRFSAWQTADNMAERMSSGVPVLFFPEGTSTDGSDVTRFHSTLFEPAIELAIDVTPAAIFYEPHKAGGLNSMQERDVCWFGDDLFFPHLLRVLDVDDFTAIVRFGTPERFADRQTAAWRSHDAVESLRSRKTAVNFNVAKGA